MYAAVYDGTVSWFERQLELKTTMVPYSYNSDYQH